MKLTPLFALLVCVPLVGCGGGSMEDLRVYTDEVLTRKSKKIDPLPEMKPYIAYTYQGVGKDPFEPFLSDEPDSDSDSDDDGSGVRPDDNRVREELEGFPLDTLRMVGTLEQTPEVWGIVLNRDGTIFRVKVGNYMGQNHGKIIAILEDRIELTEIAKDGQGKWHQREASLALAE